MKKKLIVFYLLYGLCCILNAQELPPIQAYPPDVYNAENQNWDITQSEEQYIYLANNKGLLEFNGAKWKLYPSPSNAIIRSVHAVENRIYTGSYMDFGYWERDVFSNLNFKSLAKKVDTIKEDEEFWHIINFREWVLFQSLDRIYIYDTVKDSFKIIESESVITGIYQVEDQVYFQKINEGLFKIINGKAILVSNDELFKSTIISGIFSHQNDLLVLTDTKGFFKLKNRVPELWKIPSVSILESKTIYSAIQLKDKSFLLGTISNGMLHLTENGEINYQINQNSGLINNTVLSVFQDIEENIWLGLDNGINCININSPFKIFNDDKGTLGTIYASAIFNGLLYLGTNQGLFYKRYKSDDAFSFVEGTNGQVWCLEEINNELFCGHNNGTFLVTNGKAKRISDAQGTWGIRSIPEEPNLLLVGNYNGLNILQETNGEWHYRNKIEGFNNSSRFFDFLNKNQIFVNHEYKGVFNLTVDNNYRKITKISKDTTIEKGLYSSLIKYKNELLYTYKKGVYKYNNKEEKFKKDTLLSKMFTPEMYTSGKLIYDSKTDKLWGFSEQKLSYVTSGGLSSVPIINSVYLPNRLRNSMTGFENIIHLENNNYLFGTSSGYKIVDLSMINNKSYQVEINSIKKSAIDGKFMFVDKSSNNKFNTNHNNISFSFSIPEYDKYLEPEYQYNLEGFHDQWSEWNTNSTNIFENLSHGNYTFNVRARVGETLANNTASYAFNIKRPWYLSNLMIMLYIIGVILFSYLMHTLYKRYYKKQREELLLKAQRALDLEKLESQQQLMHLKNEKLQQDIESKNRELAISTMSLIKKNEFLNSIKSELKSVNPGNDIKSVIKIIDKNINNTDDWKFFQEAFNNADKDFLKKVKTKHQALTPNDLKLCAYLRLNLSSKEIAPLLNISPRSVEVKRYRLRKKMNLSHEISLTNYILEI